MEYFKTSVFNSPGSNVPQRVSSGANNLANSILTLELP